MSRLAYFNEDFLILLIVYGECNRIIAITCRVFSDRFPDKPRPDCKTVRLLLKNCTNFGSFHSTVGKVKPQLNNEVNEIKVLAFFTTRGKASLRDAEIYWSKRAYRYLLKQKKCIFLRILQKLLVVHRHNLISVKMYLKLRLMT